MVPDKVKHDRLRGGRKAISPECLSSQELAETVCRDKGIATTFALPGRRFRKRGAGPDLYKRRNHVQSLAGRPETRLAGNLCKSIEANRMEAEARRGTASGETEAGWNSPDVNGNDNDGGEAARLRREERDRQKEIAFQKNVAEFIGEEIGREPDAVARQDGRIRRAGEERAGRNAANECPEGTVSRSPAAPQKKSNGIRPAMPSNGQANERSRERIDEIRGRRLSPQEQAQLYSPQGLTLTYRKGISNTPDCTVRSGRRAVPTS
ncbi:MAG: hypothetical protein ACLR8Y_18910 [Alistipes indistinctus]